MNTHHIELPPGTRLPGATQDWYCAQAVQSIVRAAIEADRKRRGDPVAAPAQSDDFSAQQRRIEKSMRAGARLTNHKLQLDAPQPPEPRLDAPAQVGHTRFGPGVPWSTVIGAAQRYHAMQNTPTKEQERIKKLAERVEALQAADPANVLIDWGADAARWQKARTLTRSWWRDAFNRIAGEGVTLDELIDAEGMRRLP